LGRAHTGGDLAVYLPESKVLFLGEIYMRGLFPAMRSAYPSEWLDTIKKGQAMDVSWYIPGHGFIDDAASMERDLETYRQSIATVINESQRLHSAGESCESPSACSAADKANWGQYEDWTASNNQAPFAIKRVYQQIEGTLDGAQAPADDRGLVELWEAGQTAFGQYVTGVPFTVETGRDLAANPLLDYAFLNLEQDYNIDSARDIAEGLRSGGAEPAMELLVRIPPMSEAGVETSRARVKELLAMGADGVVFPHVRSAEEARIAISFFEGVNVWSPANPDGDILVMLMLETPDVFAELEDIANIPGYSLLACGIGSLTNALGGDREAAEKLNLEVLAHSQRAGMADIITADTESVARRVNQGFLGLLVYGPTANEVIRLGRVASGR
jgi:2-keto-3-deoxy-L-rhamnonate aldolase RhmA